VAGLLHGRRALVTGAAGGIGAGVVEAFRHQGADVVGLDVRAVGDVLACDVTDEAAVEAALGAAGPLDDVVHAAGVVSTGEVATLPVEEFRRVLEINLVGSFLVARGAVRCLGSGGTVTLIASQGGLRGGAGWSAYCASKFGVVGLTESLAQEVAPRGVRVNAVCPGSIDTPMSRRVADELATRRRTTPEEVQAAYLAGIPAGRLGTAADVAGVCVFLASSLAAFVAGAALVVDGAELS
jgi:NAD(P)-dependent dehydrogenase (short-subunit alcohol dehydrogenase family)